MAGAYRFHPPPTPGQAQAAAVGTAQQAKRFAATRCAIFPEANASGLFSDRNAGKLGITLNMRHPDGVALFKKLVAISDIVIEGFRPNAMRSWGLDYETLKSVKPDIIYLQMAGFGRTGPYSSFASYGPTAQVMSGIGAHHRAARAASAHDVESLLHGRDAALLRRDRADGGALLSQPHRSGPVHRSGRSTNRDCS